MSSPIEVCIRNVNIEDIETVTELFRQGFPESLVEIFGTRKAPKEALQDIFTFLAKATPESFFVAEHDHQVLGYVVAPPEMTRIWKQAIGRGFILKAAVRLACGRYQLPLVRLPILVRNKVNFMRIPQTKNSGLGQILSITVRPGYRGHKIGKELVGAALEYLSEKKLKGVKLEVRPQNTAAVKLYESFGFVPIGSTRDSQGPWLIMKKVFS